MHQIQGLPSGISGLNPAEGDPILNGARKGGQAVVTLSFSVSSSSVLPCLHLLFTAKASPEQCGKPVAENVTCQDGCGRSRGV